MRTLLMTTVAATAIVGVALFGAAPANAQGYSGQGGIEFSSFQAQIFSETKPGGLVKQADIVDAKPTRKGSD